MDAAVGRQKTGADHEKTSSKFGALWLVASTPPQAMKLNLPAEGEPRR